MSAAALSTAGWALSADGQALYQDDFYVTQASSFVRPAVDTGWNGFADGRVYGSGNQTNEDDLAEGSLAYFGLPQPTDSGYPVPLNSNPQGSYLGAIFWSPLVNNVVLYSTKSSIAAANISDTNVRTISWDVTTDPSAGTEGPQSTNGWDLHAVLEVGGKWYASVDQEQANATNTNYGTSNPWGNFTISTAATQWYQMTLNPALAANNYGGPVWEEVTGTPIALPTGTIQGVGVGTLGVAPGGASPPYYPSLILTNYNLSHTPAPVYWDNAGAGTPSDGTTWDINNNINWATGNNVTWATASSATPNLYPTPYVDGGGSVTFNDTNNGHYAVTLNTTVNPGSVTVNNSSGNYTISGTGKIAGTGSLTKSGTGTLTLSTANTYSGGTVVNGGLLEITRTSATTSALPSGGAVTINSGTLQLASNVTAGSQPTSTPASNVMLSSLSISPNATLDINNNHIIINYGSGPDPISSIASWIVSGYNGGGVAAWTGAGITSTAAKSNSGSYGIGYADYKDAGNPAGLSSGQIEIMYTLLGDANLDGKVNGSDFTLMASNFNDSVTNGWDKGDFDYSDTVNGSDFVLLADNFNDFASQSAISSADLAAVDSFAASNGISLTSVPEPGTISLGLLASAGLLARRRQRVGPRHPR